MPSCKASPSPYRPPGGRDDASGRGKKGEAKKPRGMAGGPKPLRLSMLLPALLCASMAAAAAAAAFAPGFKPRAQEYRRRSAYELGTSVLITGNSTLVSPNQTFEIGFFTVDGGSRWYFGVWYASIPIRTYVWVANRESSVSGGLTPATVWMTAEGVMTVRDNGGRDVWRTDNAEPAAEARLLETGNLVLLSADGSGRVVWQSFDHPADTWLPDMNVSRRAAITSWRSPADPSPGPYSLRLKPPDYGEFQLVYENSTLPPIAYWSTGKWTGDRFTGVPEMTVPYIYAFRFDNPFTPDASFVYSESPSASIVLRPFLTRFVVESSGQLRQYTWSAQASSWNMFWSRPDNPCRVYALCGDMGFCREGGRHPCDCLSGFSPADPAAWGSDDYLGGCSLDQGSRCSADSAGDEFKEVGAVEFEGASMVSFPTPSRDSCEQSCLRNCSCRALNFDADARLCRNLYGNLFNLRNSTAAPVLYVRVSAGSSSSSPSQLSENGSGGQWKTVAVTVGSIGVFLAISGAAILAWMLLGRGRRKRKRERGTGGGGEDEDVLVMSNLRVFSYKELSAATWGFSEELGHGGFGAVFRGELPDSSLVAVKRLERPGGGDREFRAEVRTIGSIQHVNLVRLRGFCSEDPHRLLVYEYMPRGPLSAYLGHAHQHRRHNHPPPLQEQPQQQFLSWEDRLRAAVGTARGIAYLHEECRDCIVHCDIKPENILLDGDYTPKVSDFGLAKLIGRDFSRVLTTMRGTWGYVAPEWISGVAITAKADVYSYGMTLLELISGRRNVETPPPPPGGGEAEVVDEEDGDAEEKWFFPPWAARQIVEGNLAGVVDPRLSGAYDVREAERAALVAVWCIQDHEDARPTMGQVVKMLVGSVEVSVPPLPQLLQALVSGDSFRRVGIVSSAASHGSTSLGCGDYDNDSDDKVSDISTVNGR